MEIVSLAERPELESSADVLTDLWPPFMLHDPMAALYFARRRDHAEHAFVALEGGQVVGRAYSVPFAMGWLLRRHGLPPDGWDGVVQWAWLDHLAGRSPTHVSALEIMVAPSHRGTGLALRLVETMKDAARGIGARELVAPVRPSRKHEEPHTPMADYAAR
ncbi:MAG: GNAT family N-acetyltransferase, partial [Nitriliruptor sp.]